MSCVITQMRLCFLFTFTIVSLKLAPPPPPPRMFMSSPVKERAVVDIPATAEAHRV